MIEVTAVLESFGSTRLQRERELWIARRRSGKKTFLYLYAAIVCCGCFSLFRIPLLGHFWYGRTMSHHGKLIAASVILPLSIGVGLLVGSLLWRRGERLVNSTKKETD